MNLQEFATAAEERANVKIVLMNNRSLGLVYQQQTLFYGAAHVRVGVRAHAGLRRRSCAASASTAVDLERAADPRRALAAALRAPGPCLIHAPIATRSRCCRWCRPARRTPR